MDKLKQEVAVYKSIEVVIKNQDDLAKADTILANVQDTLKKIKAEKDGIIKPIKESIDKIKEKYAPYEEQLEEVKAKFKQAKLAYSEILEAQKATLVERVDNGEIKATTAINRIEKLGDVDGIKTIKSLFIEDETKIPREYFVIDLVKVRKDLLAGISVPGAKMVDKKIISA